MDCPTCDKNYDRIGHHWHFNPSHRPSISKKQHEYIKGMLMGDGYLKRTSKHPKLVVGMTNKKYLKHFETKFTNLTTGVKLNKEAEGNRQAEWRFRTPTHPELEEYTSWYEGEVRQWPESLKITPAILRTWYVSDGTYDTGQHHDRIVIAMTNERKNKEKIDNYFEQAGLPTPSNYNDRKRSDGEGYICVAEFTVSATRELFDYMGDAPPGFEYKWP